MSHGDGVEKFVRPLRGGGDPDAAEMELHGNDPRALADLIHKGRKPRPPVTLSSVEHPDNRYRYNQ